MNIQTRTLGRLTAACLRFLMGCAVVLCAEIGHAADNAATGGIGGLDNGTLIGGDGTGNARITLNPVGLALVKQARALDGSVLPDHALVAPGQEIYFLLYVDNPTNVAAGDVRISDALDETQFAYVPGTLEQSFVASGASDAVIWTGSWSALTDAVGVTEDPASALDTGGAAGPDRITLGSVSGQSNLPLSIPPLRLTALRFRVRVL